MNGYVAGGYAATALIALAYAWRTIRRGRQLLRSLPEDAEGIRRDPAGTTERTWR